MISIDDVGEAMREAGFIERWPARYTDEHRRIEVLADLLDTVFDRVASDLRDQAANDDDALRNVVRARLFKEARRFRGELQDQIAACRVEQADAKRQTAGLRHEIYEITKVRDELLLSVAFISDIEIGKLELEINK